MTKDVFISYRSTEASVAYMVREVLEKNGIGCWMAPESIEYGEDYTTAIPIGIENCKVLVLLLSKEAQNSPWVHSEVSTAFGAGKTIIPFLIEECEISTPFAFMLSRAQRWDAYDALSENLAKLVKVIQAHIAAEQEIGDVYNAEVSVSKELIEALERFETSDYKDGQDVLEKLAKKGDVEAQYQLGKIYRQGMGRNVDVKEAIKWYEKASKRGNMQAQSALIRLYWDGYGIGRDMKKILELCNIAAIRGDAYAQYLLGYCYEYGEGVQKNYYQAVEWYEKAYQGFYDDAIAGDADAMYQLGFMYTYGIGIEHDLEVAREYYKKAARAFIHESLKGNAWAKYMQAKSIIAGEYWDGGIDFNYWMALKDYQAAAECQCAEAMYEVGISYQNGQGTEKDMQMAVQWYEKSAHLGNGAACTKLGELYTTGTGVEKSFPKAMEWYDLGVGYVDGKTAYEIGDSFFYGNGVEKNHKKAAKWYKKAFQAFECDAQEGKREAQYRLGKMYLQGTGVGKDYRKAFYWIEKAAKNSHLDAKFVLGNLYYYGYGVKINYVKAKECYEMALALGYKKAHYMLGVLYEKGAGVERNYEKAEEHYWKVYKYFCEQEDRFDIENAYYYWKSACILWLNRRVLSMPYYNVLEVYENRAKLGDVNAMYLTGEMYRSENEYKSAFRYYEKAALLGDERAQYQLAECFYLGHGVVKNEKNAKEWYERSAEQGYAQAQYELGYLVEKNEEKAIEWLEKAAIQGHEEAMKKLGYYYYNGFYVEFNLKKALYYYRKCLKVNPVYLKYCEERAKDRSEAALLLAYLYMKGENVEKNIILALKYLLRVLPEIKSNYRLKKMSESKIDRLRLDKELLFENAYQLLQLTGAEEGVEEMYELAEDGYPKAQYEYALLHSSGRGVKRNLMKALKWYKRSAEQGYGEAQVFMGDYYRWSYKWFNGKKKSQEWYTKAFQTYRTLAEQGDADAQYNLAELYNYGIGVSNDMEENRRIAMEWYKKAAKQGHAEALYEVAVLCYQYQNKEVALKLYKYAAQLGSKSAQRMLAE